MTTDSRIDVQADTKSSLSSNSGYDTDLSNEGNSYCILKHLRNAPPAKMLIYCQNVIFELCGKLNLKVPSFSLHSIRNSKRCGLCLP